MYHYGDVKFYEEELTEESLLIEESVVRPGFKFAYGMGEVNMINVQKYLAGFNGLQFEDDEYISEGEVVCYVQDQKFYTKTEIDGEEDKKEIIEEGVGDKLKGLVNSFKGDAKVMKTFAKHPIQGSKALSTIKKYKEEVKKAFIAVSKKGSVQDPEDLAKSLHGAGMKSIGMATMLFGEAGKTLLASESFGMVAAASFPEVTNKEKRSFMLLTKIMKDALYDTKAMKNAWDRMGAKLAGGKEYDELVDNMLKAFLKQSSSIGQDVDEPTPEEAKEAEAAAKELEVEAKAEEGDAKESLEQKLKDKWAAASSKTQKKKVQFIIDYEVENGNLTTEQEAAIKK
jgi:hypothetical protein